MTIGTVSLPFACGFEMGEDYLVPAGQRSNILPEGSTVKTGNYSLEVWGGGYIQWELASTRSDLYLAAGIQHTSGRFPYLRVYLASGEWLDVRADYPYMDAHVDGAQVAGGSVQHEYSKWFHVEVYFSIANAGGQIKTWVDGIADIDYAGDTQPGASDQIEAFRLYNQANDVGCWFDNVHANSSRLYDRRVLGAVPTSDDTSQLTASGGGDNYADVDELGPDDDTTYVSTSTDAQKDLYGHGGVDLSDYTTPFWVTVWARGRKTVANGDQLRLLLESNGTEDQGDFEDLLTTWTSGYLQKLWVNDPDTGAPWANEAAIDAALIGVESNIP